LEVIIMRKLMIVAAGMAVIATSAWSQGAARDTPDRGDRDSFDRQDWHSGSYGRGDRYHDQWDNDRGRQMRSSDDEDQGTGARFVLRSGDSRLSVVCDSRESTRACVDAALTLFDRVRSQQGGTPSTTPPAQATPSAPPTPR